MGKPNWTEDKMYVRDVASWDDTLTTVRREICMKSDRIVYPGVGTCDRPPQRRVLSQSEEAFSVGTEVVWSRHEAYQKRRKRRKCL